MGTELIQSPAKCLRSPFLNAAEEIEAKEAEELAQIKKSMSPEEIKQVRQCDFVCFFLKITTPP